MTSSTTQQRRPAVTGRAERRSTLGRVGAMTWILGWALWVGAGPGDVPAIEAVWLNQDGDAHIEIGPCGERLCGTIVWLEDPLDDAGRPELDDENPDPAQRSRPILGLPILEGFPRQPNAKGLWSDGTIYDPNNGKTYSCQMSFKDRDTLKIRGYIGISLLGRTEIWSRVPADRAAAARQAMEQELAAAGGRP